MADFHDGVLLSECNHDWVFQALWSGGQQGYAAQTRRYQCSRCQLWGYRLRSDQGSLNETVKLLRRNGQPTTKPLAEWALQPRPDEWPEGHDSDTAAEDGSHMRHPNRAGSDGYKGGWQ